MDHGDFELRTARLILRPPRLEDFEPWASMLADEETTRFLGGVRSPYVDVPTARWIGAKSGPFVCLFHGYKIPMPHAELQQLYGDHGAYVGKVRARVSDLVAGRWLTPTDAAAIVQEAEQSTVP